MAGSLSAIAVPSPAVEAARELTRAHDACRRDLMNARHRVSKMLLRHGRVYPKTSTWWPTVARLRAFRGVDTLTAFAIPLELGADWARFEKAHRVGSWLGLTPSREQSGAHDRHGAITKTGSTLARRLLVESAWHAAREPRVRRDPRQPPARTTRPRAADRQPCQPAPTPRLHQHARPRQAPQRDGRRGRPGAGLLPLGRCHRTLTQLSPPNSSNPGSGRRDAGPPPRPARAITLSAAHPRQGGGVTLVLRPAHRRQQQQGHGVSESPHIRLATPSPSPTSRPPETPAATRPRASSRRNFSLPP
jgi:Transposase IS116/IS110/IS902 family